MFGGFARAAKYASLGCAAALSDVVLATATAAERALAATPASLPCGEAAGPARLVDGDHDHRPVIWHPGQRHHRRAGQPGNRPRMSKA